MSIEWKRDIAHVEESIARDFPRTGLVLRAFASGRLEDPRPLLARLPQPDIDNVEGLGDFDVWCGYSDGVPFSLYASKDGPVGWAFTLHVAIKLNKGGGLDSSLLSVLFDLPSELMALDTPYLENVPFDGPAYGVYRPGVQEPDFKSPRLHDAIAWQRGLEQWQRAGRYVADTPATAGSWMAVGASVGPYVRDLQVFRSRERAERFIQRQAATEGSKGPYTLCHGRLVAHP
ncbi:MAG: hypothetical protein V4850_26805 [Myxococcota bacterium]